MAIVYWQNGRVATLTIASGQTESDVLDLGEGAGLTQQVTRNIVKGAAGAKDQLPDSPVVSVVSVIQGATTYAVTTDYTVAGDFIDWSPAGAEPDPGTTYQVTYTFRHHGGKAYRLLDVTVLGPATVTGTVNPQTSILPTSGFLILQSQGSNIVLPTGSKAPSLIPLVARYLKLVGTAQGQDTTFTLMAVARDIGR